MTKIFPLYNIDLNSIDSQKDFSNINHDINKISFFDLKIDYNFDSKNEKIEIKSFPFEIIKEYKENKKENINTNKIFNNEQKLENGKNKFKNEDDIKNKKEQTNQNKFICTKRIIKTKIYRKDAYIKHFKAIFAKFLKNKLNALKDICFPSFSLNKFSTPNYIYTGNPKEKDNYMFLFWKIKDILIYGENKSTTNRQYNSKLIIKYIENNEKKCIEKIVYKHLINYLNNNLENAYIDFYNDNDEFYNLLSDKDCIFYDKFFKEETGFSLLEKNGFIKVISNNK